MADFGFDLTIWPHTGRATPAGAASSLPASRAKGTRAQTSQSASTGHIPLPRDTPGDTEIAKIPRDPATLTPPNTPRVRASDHAPRRCATDLSSRIILKYTACPGSDDATPHWTALALAKDLN